jgi:hypothetical protein
MNSSFDIYVYDISGRLVLQREKLFSEVEFGNELSAGTYLLRLKTAQGETSEIVVKK